MNEIQKFVARGLTQKAKSWEIEDLDKKYNAASSEEQSHIENFMKPPCDKYYETDSYKNGEEDTYGYGVCCDVTGFCGGLSGWTIFLIIVIVLGVLASAGAALWFFYLNRFFGGKEDEEKKEDYSNTEDIGSVEISVATY
uniref:Uncharacterized protein n=1 Tax=Caenorhabditis tropicalis TaxID=1561998 RepID=A0A1I7TGU4_9PELO